MSCAAIVVAGGRGRRFGGHRPKQYRFLRDRPLLCWTLDAFERCSAVHNIVLVVAPEERARVEQLLRSHPCSKLQAICDSGAERVDSVRSGLNAVGEDTSLVAIHDAARPLVSPELIGRVVAAAAESGAAIAALPAADTIKLARDGLIEQTIARGRVFMAQTPQVFTPELLRRAYDRWDQRDRPAVTDDAQLVEELGHGVRLVVGEASNLKITVEEDLVLAEAILARHRVRTRLPRSGMGYDVHRFEAGRRLVLGGVEIPFELGLLGHSDADVLAHAISDALLGAAALGDIGHHFPPDNPRYKDADSLQLLAHVRDLIERHDYTVANVDAVVVCERPKLAPYIGQMRERLAVALRVDIDAVSVKATTSEGLGFMGRQEGIAAYATASLVPV